MSNKQRVLRLKIVMLGDGAVGKTSIVQRYMGLGFRPVYLMTIGANFYAREITYYDEKFGKLHVTLVVWDLAGQPRFNEVRNQYYKGAKLAIIVFDVSKRETLKSVKKWANEFWNNVKEKFPIILVGNKIDLRESADTVSHEEGINLARELSEELGFEVPYVEASAKTGENINEIFNKAVELALRWAVAKSYKGKIP